MLELKGERKMENKMSVFQILETFGQDAYLTASITKAGEHNYIPAGDSDYEYEITRIGRPILWEYNISLIPRRSLFPV